MGPDLQIDTSILVNNLSVCGKLNTTSLYSRAVCCKHKQKTEVAMKRTFLLAIMVIMSLSPISCGHDHNNQTITTQILSDPAIDGDILQTSLTTFTVTQGMTPTIQSVFAGIDPVSLDESRAFLDFPLTGPGGVPGDAVIVKATLNIVITNVSLQVPTDTIPIRIELVSPGLILVQDDFSRTLLPAIAFTTIEPPISSADIGGDVPVDVTSLMVQAQNLGLADFQVRILEDLVPAAPAGLIEINDATGSLRGNFAPLLEVEYF